MQIKIPEGERLFAWTTQSEPPVRLIVAPNEAAAFEAAILIRMNLGQTREEAEGWFQHDDRLDEVAVGLGVIHACDK